MVLYSPLHFWKSKFSSTIARNKVLQLFASADEGGNLCIFSSMENRAGQPMKPQVCWPAHKNAVFDVMWSYDNEHLVSASGDLNSAVWDVETQKLICMLVGHNASVKCISANPQIEYATSSRDGSIMFWDTRCSGGTSFEEYHQRPVDKIKRAHETRDCTSLTKKPRLGSSNSVPQAVTCVLFISDRFMVSGGATDGVIKMWDMRFRGGYSSADILTPYATSAKLGDSRYPHGVSSISATSCGERIFVTCLNNKIYEFSSNDISNFTRVFFSDSYRCKSFYVKSSISPGDRLLATGSSSQKIYIWNICDSLAPPITLEGHTDEVTGISWNSCLLGQISSCSDDYSIRLWEVPTYFKIPAL